MKKILFCLLLALPFLHCTKNNNEYDDPFYFRATINGQALEWIAPFADAYSTIDPKFGTGMPTAGGSMPYWGCNTGEPLYQYHEGTYIYEHHDNSLNLSNSLSVSFVLSGDDFSTASTQLRSQFTNGAKTYGQWREICSDAVFNGILIAYTDASGKTWRSKAGDPAHNTFEQVALDEETRTMEYHNKWKVRFSSRLYDGSGNYIEVKNAEVYGPALPL